MNALNLLYLVALTLPVGGQVSHCKPNGKCLALVSHQQPTWTQAETYCQQHFSNQGHLASLHLHEDKLIISLWLPFLSTNPWVGGYHFGNLSYHWTDGTPFDYHNWLNGQPNLNSGCIKLCHSESSNCSTVGKWYSAPCSETGQLICEYGNLYAPPTTTLSPTTSIHGPIQITNAVCRPGSNRCFTAFSAQVTWSQAESYCDHHNFTALASIQDGLDNTLIDSFVIAFPNLLNDVWVGGIRTNAHGPFTWSDGTPFSYHQWANGQPTSGGPVCVKVCKSTNGVCHTSKWVADQCDKQLSFVCENGTVTITTQPPPSTTPAVPTDCLDIYNNGNTQSGIYTIHPPNYPTAFQVLCDMTDGGGWTVIQKRTDDSLAFWNQYWTAYKYGFNNALQRNHWLGLGKIHALSTKDSYVTLRSDMWGNRCTSGGDCTDPPYLPNGYWFDEREFYIDSESNQYTLHVTDYTASNVSDNVHQYNYDNGAPFSTIDIDHSGANCVTYASFNWGAWWHPRSKGCSWNLALNGQYGRTQAGYGLMFNNGHSSHWINPIRTQMRLRRNTQ